MIEPILPDLISIPAGPVWLGSDDETARPNEGPVQRFEVAAFAAARTPVTVEEFVRFIEAGKAVQRYWQASDWLSARRSCHPIRNVAWEEAVAYCAWLAACTGKPYRLPNEAEWERMAKGATRQHWPWGDVFDPACANTCEAGHQDTSPVDAHPEGASPWGILDLAGNVWEWTSDLYLPYPYRPTIEAEVPPLPPSTPELIVNESRRRAPRGGSKNCDASWARCSTRSGWRPVWLFSGLVGFRVVCDLV